jgi:hypothetical protein
LYAFSLDTTGGKNKKAATGLPSGARQLACGQKWEPDTVAARLGAGAQPVLMEGIGRFLFCQTTPDGHYGSSGGLNHAKERTRT